MQWQKLLKSKENKKMLLKEKSKQFKLVIECYDNKNQKYYNTKDIQEWLINNQAIKNYYMIQHDKDDTQIHIHLVLETYKDYSCKTILMSICEWLGCNINLVSIEVSRDLCHDVRYLTHKDDTIKYHYDDDYVITNLNSDYEDLCNNMNYSQLDFQTLYKICKSSANVTEVYSKIGLKSAKEYRNIICDIMKCGGLYR